MNPQDETFTPKFKPGDVVYSYELVWNGEKSARFVTCILYDREEIQLVFLNSSGVQYLFTGGRFALDMLFPEEKIFRTEKDARKAFYREQIRLLEEEQQNITEYIENIKHEMEKLDEKD